MKFLKNILSDSQTLYKPYYLFKCVWTLIALPALLYNSWWRVTILKFFKIDNSLYSCRMRLFKYEQDKKNIIWFESEIEYKENSLKDNVIVAVSMAPLLGLGVILGLGILFSSPVILLYTLVFFEYLIPNIDDYCKCIEVSTK